VAKQGETVMTTKKIGQLDDWGDADLGGGDYLKLEEGSNIGRVFTKPYQFYIVWTEDASGKKRKFRSAVENCPLVQRGEKAKPQWMVGYLSRKTGKPQILEMGPQIYKGILTLKKKEVWGDPRRYDIDIERMAPNSQPLYVVSPLPAKPLVDEEKELIKEFMDRTDFVELTAAPTPEEVMEQLGISPTNQTVSNDFDDFGDGGKEPTAAADDDDYNFDNM